MGFADILTNAANSKYVVPALLGSAVVAGTRPSKTSTTSGAAPGYQTLADLLKQRATDRLNAYTDMGGYTANGISSINDAFRGVKTNSDANLTSRGLGTSPVASTADTNINLARGGNIAEFLNTVPLLQQQLQDQGLQAAQGVYAGAPRTTTQTGADGGLSGGIQSAHELLAYLNGKGVLGAAGAGIAGLGGAGSIAAPGIASIIGASGGGTAVGAGTSLASILAGGVPELPSSSIGLGAAAAHTSTVGAESAAHALLTNPWTAVVGAGIIATVAILKSQAHWEANTFVQNVQNPFGQKLSESVDKFDQLAASGRLDKATALSIRNQVASVTSAFEAARQQFATKGSDEAQVAANAKRTMDTYFGPNFQNVLQKMDATISSLRG